MFSAEEFESVLNKIVQNKVSDILEKEDVLVRKAATVAAVDSANNKASVYFINDATNASCFYPNKTNANLAVGEKVYVFHKYGKEGQGWIMLKA